MARFDFQEFLTKTGLSIPRLASYLQVAQTYLEAVAAGEARLTARDQEACRILRRRLFGGKQLELPFPDPPETFTHGHARRLARDRARKSTAAKDTPRTTRKARPAASRRKPVPPTAPEAAAVASGESPDGLPERSRRQSREEGSR